MDQVEEIKQKLDIADVISGYIRLTPAGIASFKANCPFHSEKTPSFMVSREKQIFKCFGCGKGGDIFSFVMEMEGIDFKEALEILAQKAGVQLKKQDPKIAGEKNKVLDCLEMASKFYYQVLLNASSSENAREYLKKRKINEDTIDNFKIGYAPDSWNSLYNALIKKGFYANDIEKAGLLIKKQNSNDYYDRFRNRIMFPIKDVNGRVIGFSGRILEQHPPAPPQAGKSNSNDNANTPAKYINTPQTIMFDKSRSLYAIDKARDEIRKSNLAVIVEGQMDVIASHQAGIKNVIASSGTALTLEHLKIIKRYTSNIALSFDGDEAGKTAARRAVELALPFDMAIKIIKILGAKDPDECIRENPEKWKQAILDARKFMDYYFNETIANANLEKIEEKKKASKKMLELISKISNKVEQTHYLQKLAMNLNAREIDLREEMDKMRKNVPHVLNTRSEYTLKPKDINTKIAERIISFCIIYAENLPYVVAHLLPEFITSDKLNNLYKRLIIYYTENQGKESFLSEKNALEFFKNFALEEGAKEEKDYFDELWIYGEKEIIDFKEGEEILTPQRVKLELEKGISELKESYNKRKLTSLQRELQKAEEENNKEKIEFLSKEFNKIMGEMSRNLDDN